MPSICVFGSVARKSQDSFSDKDVLIIYDSTEKTTLEYKKWLSQGWSIANYTSNRLKLMAKYGSLFLQHIKQEGLLISDSEYVLSNILSGYAPKTNYDIEIEESLEMLKLLEHTPHSHLLDYWSADILFVAMRNLGIMLLANEGIYKFSFDEIASELIRIGKLNIEQKQTFEEIRQAKVSYRLELFPIKDIKKQ